MLLINDLSRHNQAIRKQLNASIDRVMDSGWFVLGPEVKGFESEFADYCGVKHCTTVANGTDALELALRALGIKAGDKVITVANAGMYSTTAINLIGAQPVYIDVCSDTMNIDLSLLKKALASDIKAIIVTHLYGRMVDVTSVMAMADEYGIPVIEDCAQAHGAIHNGKRSGSVGDIACFSFYPTKNLGALGDGGAVVTNDRVLNERLVMLRQYGWKSKYCVSESLGRNSRLDELQAAVLRQKLPYLDGWNDRRRAIARIYSEKLGDVRGIKAEAIDSSYVAHLYVIRLKNRDGLKAMLAAHSIASDIHFPLPDYHQACMLGKFQDVYLSETEKCSLEVLTLPCFPELNDDEVNRVADTVLMFVKQDG